MLKKLTRLVGLKEQDFLSFVESKQITFSEARLIPLLKTGDEMALTSIFLSSLRLVKEFRDAIFRELKIPRSGKYYYLTEVKFPDLSNHRVDGLIVVVKSGKVADATIFEMKKETNPIDSKQLEDYMKLALALKIPKVVTVSNQYVSNSSESPLDVKVSKRLSLYHFSWTYLLTIGRILLFKNDTNIKDEDQVEIMREVLHYFESDKSGVRGYTHKAPEWKQLTEAILAHKTLKESDDIIHKSLNSWYQQEKDMALKLSRELGVLVKTPNKSKEKIKSDINYIIKHQSVKGKISVRDAVSDIRIEVDFERKNVKMLVDVNCPATGTNTGKVNWLIKQLANGKKRSSNSFDSLFKNTWVAVDIKYARNNIVESIEGVDNLKSLSKKDEIQGFEIYVVQDLGRQFTSQKGFVSRVEKLLIEFYDGYVQYLANLVNPAPKIEPPKMESLSND